ncbi:hypothetical protein V496_00622 [Pseudogymnoascus sp. VKM F-4515 (FW-2607)]|nr:hypothetical protein V496_00622 [Pseudogymnoascus sp. VKM F-4515 (FW-2607)]
MSQLDLSSANPDHDAAVQAATANCNIPKPSAINTNTLVVVPSKGSERERAAGELAWDDKDGAEEVGGKRVGIITRGEACT